MIGFFSLHHAGRPAFHYVETKRHLVSVFEKKVRSGLVDVAQYGRVIKSGWGDNPSRTVIEDIENTLLSRIGPDRPIQRDACPLHVAVFKEKHEQVKLLLNHGANVDAQDCFGLTCLHLAAMRGNMKLIQLLENEGAAADIRDNEGRLPSDVAKENEQTKVVHYLQGKQHLGEFEVCP